MTVLNNTDLAARISDSDCGDCEAINRATSQSMESPIFVLPVHTGGSGINGSQRNNVVATLEVISEEDAGTVNGLITTSYEIISRNGYPG